MVKKLFVGNLPYDVTSAQLEELFSQAGKVQSVNIITDRYTGQGKGFCFVEMSTEEETQEAIKKFNGYSLNDRAIVVNEARPQENKFGGGGNRGGYGGGNRGGYSGKRW